MNWTVFYTGLFGGEFIAPMASKDSALRFAASLKARGVRAVAIAHAGE